MYSVGPPASFSPTPLSSSSSMFGSSSNFKVKYPSNDHQEDESVACPNYLPSSPSSSILAASFDSLSCSEPAIGRTELTNHWAFQLWLDQNQSILADNLSVLSLCTGQSSVADGIDHDRVISSHSMESLARPTSMGSPIDGRPLEDKIRNRKKKYGNLGGPKRSPSKLALMAALAMMMMTNYHLNKRSQLRNRPNRDYFKGIYCKKLAMMLTSLKQYSCAFNGELNFAK